MPRCAERLGDIDCDPLPAPLAPARNGERGSAAADKAALLAFTDIMVQVHRERVQGTHVDAMSISWPLSWRRTTAPCDRHVDEKRLGWAGVMCDAVDGRVVYLSFSDAGPAPACQDAHALNIGYLQPLAQVRGHQQCRPRWPRADQSRSLRLKSSLARQHLRFSLRQRVPSLAAGQAEAEGARPSAT